MRSLTPLKQLPPLVLVNRKSPLNKASRFADDALIRSRRWRIWKSTSSSSSSSPDLPAIYTKGFILLEIKLCNSISLIYQSQSASTNSSKFQPKERKKKKKKIGDNEKGREEITVPIVFREKGHEQSKKKSREKGTR